MSTVARPDPAARLDYPGRGATVGGVAPASGVASPPSVRMENALLLGLGALISREISAIDLLDRLVDVIARVLGADRGTIYLLDEARGELVSVAAHLPELQELRVPLGQGVAGYVGRTGELVNLPHKPGLAQQWGGVDRRTGYTTLTMLAAPMRRAGGALLGVIQLLNKHDGTFDDSDEALLMRLAGQAAALLEETTLGRADVFTRAVSPRAATDDDEPLASVGEQFNRVVGRGAAMRDVFRAVRRVAPTEASVLLRGESGTGKGVIARALHYNSARRDGPLVVLDVTTLPESLVESELFGHERGAFTGAAERAIGRVEAANHGTLFLDEIGDLPLSLQAKLLTLLQDRTFYRVGGRTPVRAELRVIAATNRDLEAAVRAGTFREDLYYRLRVVQITLPPLRERGREDLLGLIEHFLQAASKRHRRPVRAIRHDALAQLLAHRWPGNVRELENCLESAVIFADEEITPRDLSLPLDSLLVGELRAPSAAEPPRTCSPPSSLDSLLVGELRAPSTASGLGPAHPRSSLDSLPAISAATTPFDDEPTLAALEARYIAYLLARHGDNRTEVARILGIGRNTLWRKLSGG
jgi:Nif-specific regulatory protein